MADEKLKKHEIPLDGKLITSVDPSLIGHNYQELTNMRYYGGRIRGVGGMTQINTNIIDATYYKVRNGIHYTKDQPSESHILVQAFNPAVDASRILDNTTAIPTEGDFSATSLYTPSGTAGRWSQAPDGDVAFCDGENSCIWGGDERRISGFVSFDPAEDFYYDYTAQVQNTKSDSLNKAIIHTVSNGGDVADMYLGSVRPLQGFRLYVETANTNASAMTVYYWNGSAWAAVSSLSDGTDTGASLAQTGSVTFTSTVSTAKQSYINESFLYWYKINVDDVSANTAVYYVTLDAAFQPVQDIWSGEISKVDYAQKQIGGVFSEITLAIRENIYDPNDSSTFIELDGMTTGESFIIGFAERMSGLDISVVDGKGNDTANTTVSVAYYNGDDWVSVGTVSDGTIWAGVSLGASGTLTWNPIVESSEFKQSINNRYELYYYKVYFSQNLSADVQIFYVNGIKTSRQISAYKFPLFSNDRLLLCCDEKGRKNSLICSAQGSSSVFNGEDTTEIRFGDEKELIGGAWLYSQYGSSVFNITLLFKKSEIWALIGTGPADWIKYRVSSVIGCVDPETIKVIDMPPQTTQTLNRNIVIWRSANGIYMSDGRSPIKLSDDIDDVFDKRLTTKINNSVPSFATWDSYYNCYHWGFASGDATIADKEYVLDVVKPGWFEIDRTSTKKLQYAIEVKDTDGANYNYGFINTGYSMYLDYGNDFDGQDIDHTFRFGDMAPAKGSVSTETQAEYVGLIAKSKTTTSSDITITHYGDSKSTGTEWTRETSKSGYNLIVPVYHKSIGPYIFHSVKCQISTDNENYGFEPLYCYVLYKIVRDHIRDWRS